MTTAESHLLEILNFIFKSKNNNVTNEKNWFKNWIKKWIVGKESVEQVFYNYKLNEINNTTTTTTTAAAAAVQTAHNNIFVKYSRCFFTYNYEFITDLLFYISTVYYDFLIKIWMN